MAIFSCSVALIISTKIQICFYWLHRDFLVSMNVSLGRCDECLKSTWKCWELQHKIDSLSLLIASQFSLCKGPWTWYKGPDTACSFLHSSQADCFIPADSGSPGNFHQTSAQCPSLLTSLPTLLCCLLSMPLSSHII